MSVFSETFTYIADAESRISKAKLPDRVRQELLHAVLLLPFMWGDLRARVAEEVLATDASEGGGGACVSTGVTPAAHQRLRELRLEAGGDKERNVLVVSSFDGTGGLLAAVRLAGVTPCGAVVIGKDKIARKVVRTLWPEVAVYNDILEVKEADVKEWLRWYPQATKVLKGLASPVRGSRA